MGTTEGCQLPGLPRAAVGRAEAEPQPLIRRFKRSLARPWNYQVKPRLKRLFNRLTSLTRRGRLQPIPVAGSAPSHLKAGDLVRVRSREENLATLDRFHELKGCAFLDSMWQYCGSLQRVLTPMERFLDERDYQVKKTRGMVLLEGVLCTGTPVFGRCDRRCHLFWREEWLEKIEEVPSNNPS